MRVALRTLERHRGFSAVAIASLAIAIALNTTMYGVLDGLLRPRVNVRNVERVYSLRFFGDRHHVLSPGALEEALREGLPAFESATGMLPYALLGAHLLESRGYVRRIDAAVVRTDFFTVLGAVTAQGRAFNSSDGSGTAVVISDRLARALFRGEPAVGQPLEFDAHHLVVVGVVEGTQSYQPLSYDIWLPEGIDSREVPVTLLRLRQGASMKAVANQLHGLAARLSLSTGEAASQVAFRLRELPVERGLRPFHRGLIAAVIAILVVACANLANLQLARGLARSRELALRAAVGASRRQLVKHLMLESGLLAAFGVALGMVLTLWGMQTVDAFVPPEMEGYITAPRPSWGMFAFAALAGVVCLGLVGLMPALHVSRVDPNDLLKAGNGTGANRRNRRRYGAMIVVQVALALPVLVGAVVALRGALRWHDRDYFAREFWGFDPVPIVAASVRLPLHGHAGIARLADAEALLVSGARAVRGVTQAAASFSRAPLHRAITVDDENGVMREVAAPGWSYRLVSPSYFRTMGRAMERGRDFVDGEQDGEGVIMDAPTSRFLWGNRNPIGRSVKFADAKTDARWHTVIGIVGDMRDTFAIRRALPDANYRLYGIYRTFTPGDSVVVAGTSRTSMLLHARADGSSELAALRLQRALHELEPDGKPAVGPMLPFLSESRVTQDFVASLFGVFACVGLSLVCVGIYGIVAHSVAERRRELAVRLSLGATARDVLHAVLREGNVLLLAGIAMGLWFSARSVWWLAYIIGSSDVYDAPLFAAVAAGLFLTALAAALVPGWRATRIDPAEALRHE